MYFWVPYRVRIVPGESIMGVEVLEIDTFLRHYRIFHADAVWILYVVPVTKLVLRHCNWPVWGGKTTLVNERCVVKVTRPLFDWISEGKKSNRLPNNTSIFCYSKCRSLLDVIRIISRNSSRMNSNLQKKNWFTSGLISGLRQANERRRYFVTTSPIGWVQA